MVGFRRVFPFFAALLLALLVAVPASAGVTTLGSDLKGDANVIEDHGADSAFWNVQLESGAPTAAPVGGQVLSVKVKGTVLPDPNGRHKPLTMIHFQTLHPMGDGTMRVELSSGAFYVPLGGDPNQISTYHPINMCLNKGDYLDFNDIGGNEWHWGPYSGMPFRTFSAVRGSATSFYTKNRGTNVHSRWAPMWTRQGEELLMQMKFATGPHATDICPGGFRQHVFKGLDLRDGGTVTVSSGGPSVTIRSTCPGPTYGACRGVARAEAIVDGKNMVLGSASFNVPASYTKSIEIPFTPEGMRAIKKAGSLTMRVVADGHDDPAHDSRVYRWRALERTRDDRVPVQRKTTYGTMTVKRAK